MYFKGNLTNFMHTNELDNNEKNIYLLTRSFNASGLITLSTNFIEKSINKDSLLSLNYSFCLDRFYARTFLQL